MESNIEEQLRDKEAVHAENAAQQALIAQYEAEVGVCATAAGRSNRSTVAGM